MWRFFSSSSSLVDIELKREIWIICRRSPIYAIIFIYFLLFKCWKPENSTKNHCVIQNCDVFVFFSCFLCFFIMSLSSFIIAVAFQVWFYGVNLTSIISNSFNQLVHNQPNLKSDPATKIPSVTSNAHHHHPKWMKQRSNVRVSISKCSNIFKKLNRMSTVWDVTICIVCISVEKNSQHHQTHRFIIKCFWTFFFWIQICCCVTEK